MPTLVAYYFLGTVKTKGGRLLAFDKLNKLNSNHPFHLQADLMCTGRVATIAYDRHGNKQAGVSNRQHISITLLSLPSWIPTALPEGQKVYPFGETGHPSPLVLGAQQPTC